ncbi:hypothetical protein [Aeromonas salmonicida]|uniref:hypothetical protein n=1 Tax=Aeromonas salmonicida TaxID=645 RepID=UPI0030CDF070
MFCNDDSEVSAENVIARAHKIIRYAAPDGLHIQGEAMQVAAYLEAPNTLRQLLPILESLSTSEELKAVISAMERLSAAVTRYHLALDRREHGGVAASKMADEVQDILGQPWIQGAALAEQLGIGRTTL